MNEEQKKKVLNLIYGMPFLGGQTVSRDDFVEGLIANLEILQETLRNHVERHEEMKRELQAYREATKGLQFLLGQK